MYVLKLPQSEYLAIQLMNSNDIGSILDNTISGGEKWMTYSLFQKILQIKRCKNELGHWEFFFASDQSADCEILFELLNFPSQILEKYLEK